ncbi:MAG: OmpH family outer membrane protein [Alphaproteobacteria bacterium]|nr:OmpH family outer membrane protein [Alphaproteobacteria bacterium]
MNGLTRGLIVAGVMALVGALDLPLYAQNAPATAPKAPAQAPAPAAAPLKPAPAATAAPAAKLKVPVVAIIDAQAMLEKSDAAKSAKSKIEAIRDDLQKKISVEGEALKEEERTLQTQQTILSADAYAKKRQDLQKKVSDLERKVTEARRWLTATNEGVNRYITSALVEVVAKLAEERGVDIVIQSSQVLYAAAALDVTDDVMARLNKRLPDIPINSVAIKNAADVKP